VQLIDLFDRGISWREIQRSMGKKVSNWREKIDKSMERSRLTMPQLTLGIISLLMVLSLGLILRLEEPIAQLRYSSPETYQQLLIVQQIIARNLPNNQPVSLWEAIAAFGSIMSGVDPQQVVRFFGAFISFILISILGYTIYKLTKNFTISLLSIYSLAIYIFTWKIQIPEPIFQSLGETSQTWLGAIIYSLNQGYLRQWNNNSVEVGVIFTLLAIIALANARYRHKRRESIINICCCVLVLGIVNPYCIPLVIFAGFSIILGREVALFTLSISWLFLSLFAALPNSSIPLFFLQTISIALALNLAVFLIILIRFLHLMLSQWSEIICGILVIALTLNFFLANPPEMSYLEYEIAARKTLEIKNIFPRKSWTIIAPTEQLAQSYGTGWYEDLAQFVYKYGDKVREPDFILPYTTPHTFVFIEKRPFQSQNNNSVVPYSTLNDPTYQNYRSLPGRTKLVKAGKKLCDEYLQKNPKGDIYYEDQDLMIYYFPRRANLKDLA
jgi:hypothetical protein